MDDFGEEIIHVIFTESSVFKNFEWLFSYIIRQTMVLFCEIIMEFKYYVLCL